MSIILFDYFQVATVREVGSNVGLKSEHLKGTKLEILKRMQDKVGTKSFFKKIFEKIWGRSGTS